jgi:Flp pilus assembly CpaE family ATPase
VSFLNAEDAHHAEQAHALASSDHVILTTRLDMVSLRRTQRYLTFLRSHGVPTELVHIVAMGAGRSAEISPKEVLGALSVREIHCIPADDVAQLVSVNVGRPMVLEMPQSKASHALVQLCKRITGDDDSEPPDSTWSRSLRAATIAAASLLAAR